MVTTTMINLELARLKRDMSVQEIADKTGLVYLTVWRKFNGQSPIDLKFIETLENSGLINPLDRLLEAII
jgi:transcriptional regulator with XRE-family HTH domain